MTDRRPKQSQRIESRWDPRVTDADRKKIQAIEERYRVVDPDYRLAIVRDFGPEKLEAASIVYDRTKYNIGWFDFLTGSNRAIRNPSCDPLLLQGLEEPISYRLLYQALCLEQKARRYL